MSTLVPTLSSVLVVPGLNDGKRQVVSLGLVLDGERVIWGEIAAATPTSLPLPALLHQKIIPILQGQPLDQFRRLDQLVADLRETITLTRPLPPVDDTPKFSRRDLLTASLDRPTGPRTERVKVETPLPLALRYGVSKLLLAAAAQAHTLTPAELLAHEYHLPRPDAPVPLHAELIGPQSAQLALQQGVGSLGLRIAAEDAAALIGPQGEKLQRFVRQLKEVIVKARPQNNYPTLFLDVQGGLGQLYDNQLGKILGALYGLEQAAKPVPLRLADPVRLADGATQPPKMAEIKELLKLRGMALQLIARVGVDNAAAAQTFLSEQVADGICVDLEQVGSLAQAVEMVLAAKEKGRSVLLCGREPDPLAHIALATRPTAVFLYPGQDGIAPLHNEMARILAWLKPRHTQQ